MGTMRIAFQGTAGAYSEEALLKVFPEAKPVGFPTFHQVFEAVEAGEAELGVVPVENTTAGSINQTYDLLLESDLHVVGEIVHRVEHCLLAPKGTTLKDLHAVKSHPQALAQCDGFLARMRLTPIPVFDTAGAAKELAEHPEPGLAAIASRRAAELYGLRVLAENIEDYPHNYTRFFVIGHKEPPRGQGPYKTSIVFAVRHRPGGFWRRFPSSPRRGEPHQAGVQAPEGQALQLPLLPGPGGAPGGPRARPGPPPPPQAGGLPQGLGLLPRPRQRGR